MSERCSSCGLPIDADRTGVRYMWQPVTHAEAECIRALRAELDRVATRAGRVTLTVREIADLAQCVKGSGLDEEYTIEPANPDGVLNEDTGQVERFRFVAYLSEYPEEGVHPLGDPLPPPPAPEEREHHERGKDITGCDV